MASSDQTTVFDRLVEMMAERGNDAIGDRLPKGGAKGQPRHSKCAKKNGARRKKATRAP